MIVYSAAMSATETVWVEIVSFPLYYFDRDIQMQHVLYEMMHMSVVRWAILSVYNREAVCVFAAFRGRERQ